MLTQVVVGCLVSASSSEALLPSAQVITDRSQSMSLSAEMTKKNGMKLLSSSLPSSSSSYVSPASATGYTYQETDVRLYQSSAAFDSSLPSSMSQLPPSTALPSQSSFQNLAQTPIVQAMSSATLFVMINMIIQQCFHRTGIMFPSSLAGCMVLATSLLATPNHTQVYNILSPGAKLLQKFLMVFLVPNLIVLPLCDGCGSITEVRTMVNGERCIP